MAELPPFPYGATRLEQAVVDWLLKVATVAIVADDTSDIESDIDTLKGSVNTNTAAIAALATSVGGNSDDIATLAGLISANAASITALASAVSTNAADISALTARIATIEGLTHMRAALVSVALPDATWTAVSLGAVESADGAFIDAPTFTLPAGDYSIELTTAFTGPTAVEVGYTTDGGSNWTSLATGIGSPETVTATFAATDAVQFGFRATGAGTFDSGSVEITPA